MYPPAETGSNGKELGERQVEKREEEAGVGVARQGGLDGSISLTGWPLYLYCIPQITITSSKSLLEVDFLQT